MTQPELVSPTVSVILTFFNNEDYVDSAIDAVLAQTFRDFELIVTDDGSTDDTARRIRSRIEGVASVRFLDSVVNRGIATTRNAAVLQARGRYVWFVDCDDAWSPRILDTLVTAAQANRADISICRAVRAESLASSTSDALDGKAFATTLTAPETIRALVLGDIRGYLWNKLIRTALLRQHPFPALSSQSDLAGIAGVMESAERVAFTPELLYWHLVRQGSITNSRNPNLENIRYCWLRIRELAVSSGAFKPDAAELVYLDYWQYYAPVVNTYFRVGSDDQLAVRAVRSKMTVGGLVTVFRFDKRLSVICALMKYGGRLYPHLYHNYRTKRARASQRNTEGQNARSVPVAGT